jgi:hypothetical protein
MQIIVADRRGMVFSAVEDGLRKRNIEVPLAFAPGLKKLRELLRSCDDCVVISGQLLSDFTTNELLATEVKKMNPRAIVVVYNGVIEKYHEVVDLRIPSYVQKGDGTIGLHIVDFLSRHVFVAGSGVYVQLELNIETR